MNPILLLINPNTSIQTTALMLASAQAVLPPGFTLEGATAARGVPMITTEPDLAVAEAEVIAIGQARVAGGSGASGVAAVLVGAFGNPGLEALRRSVSVPVVGIGEAAMLEAAMGGRRFGIATTTPGLDASITRAVHALGLQAQFTGTRIPPGDPLVLAASPGLQEERLAQAVQACVAQDGAEAVVIGGGPLVQAAEQLALRFLVPVISPVAAGVRLAVQRVQASAAQHNSSL